LIQIDEPQRCQRWGNDKGHKVCKFERNVRAFHRKVEVSQGRKDDASCDRMWPGGIMWIGLAGKQEFQFRKTTGYF
jgi:hypothetical protein